MTKDQWLWLGLGVGLVSLLPIWRQGSIRNLTIWEYIRGTTGDVESWRAAHIPYEQAVSEASAVYNWGIE